MEFENNDIEKERKRRLKLWDEIKKLKMSRLKKINISLQQKLEMLAVTAEGEAFGEMH